MRAHPKSIPEVASLTLLAVAHQLCQSAGDKYTTYVLFEMPIEYWMKESRERRKENKYMLIKNCNTFAYFYNNSFLLYYSLYSHIIDIIILSVGGKLLSQFYKKEL